MSAFKLTWRNPLQLRGAGLRVPGYRPGATLGKVCRELGSAWPQQKTACEAGSTCVVLEPAEVAPWRARERVQRHFLMHVVTVELVMDLPGPSVVPTGCSIALHHTGWRDHGALGCRLKGAKSTAALALGLGLCADARVQSALAALDYGRCEVQRDAQGWHLCIEPYGGSEIVNRYPSFRRYVRLGDAQAQALHASALALADALQRLNATL